MRPALLLPLLMLLHGCTSAPPQASVFDRPAQAVGIVPLYAGSSATPAARAVASTETQAALALASQKIRQAQKIVYGYADSDRLLALATEAASEGNNPRAQSLARQAQARAEGAIEVQRTREAATLLKVLYDSTGLSDAQLAAIRVAEAELVRGHNAAAIQQLQSIKAKAQAPRAYQVQRGDTLTAIAAREGVYGNSLLWPLIWQANRDTLPDPNRLRPGQQLKIRPAPSVDEVVQAIKTARLYPSRVRIGKVKTLPKQ